MTRLAAAATLAIVLLTTLIVSGHDSVAYADGPSFNLSWDVSSSTVSVGVSRAAPLPKSTT